jgi:RNA polymerase sigma-70 factor (ECF subfamily)
VTLRDELVAATPRLRRYARALVVTSAQPSALADDLVHATLLRALNVLSPDARADVLATAYGLLTELHRDVAQDRRAVDAAAAGTGFSVGRDRPRDYRAEGLPSSLAEGLSRLRLDEREALLLVVVERLSHAEAARVLRVSPATLIARLGRARATLAAAGTAGPRRRDHLKLVR